jgi:hypothetical protein
MQMFTKNFLHDKKGIFVTAVVIVIVLFVADITYLVVALVNVSFLDLIGEIGASNVNIIALDAVLRNVGPITIVVINIGLVLLLVVSAWKRQTVETVEDLV